MVVYPLIQQLPCLADLSVGSDLSQQGLLWQSIAHSTWTAIDWSLIAQFETDVFRPVREFFENFIESGQIWAFLIGLVLGYLFRSLTSYG
ncbi:hypothetical protein [Egbenema bharatensis]|uniref:hypothetical protein n=1 Tax=Egbenema bharatensis TaxID=3463334 RepID=UPI003A857D50